MKQSKTRFRHVSLQDARSIQNLLKAITKGIAKGQIAFRDEDGEIVMEPAGLLQLKVTADKEENRHRLNIRISWQVEDEQISKKKPLSVTSK